MKRVIILIAALAMTSAAFAQTETPVVFDTHGDNLGISIAGFNISLGKDDRAAVKQKPKRVVTNFIGLSFGANVLSYEDNYGNWAEENNFMTDKTSAYRIGVEVMGVEVSLDRKSNVFFRASLNNSNDFFSFKNPMTLINDEAGALMPAPITGDMKKSRMVASYLGVGAGFGFNISKVRLNLDFNVDALCGARAKYKCKDTGKTKYDVSGLNNIRYRTGASITVDDFGVYVDYSLTPLFRQGVGNDGRILSIGVRAGF
jgi:opacity protein-like surface antigen